MKVVDDSGEAVPAGEVGEIWIRGPMVVPGYWQNPSATASEFTDGFWHSGDIGSVDPDGFLRVLDRKKDVINRGGLKIYPAEVENVLLGVAGLAEAAVLANPCPVLGERVHAFIVASDPNTAPSEAEVRRVCEQSLADYKIPESYTFSPRPLPRNPNGKVLKRELRALLTSSHVPGLG